jgi:hypothetical protein
MSIFKCSGCDYSSNLKHNVTVHTENFNLHKIKPDVIKIENKINCEFCDKDFLTEPGLNRHIKICKIKKTNLEKELDKQKNNEIEEKYKKLLSEKK